MTRLFISYAHDDRRLLGNFLKHLDAVGEALKKAGEFSYWFDGDLKGGQTWDERIKAELGGADAFLLFVTPTFMASKYIQETEWPAIAAAREERGALVVPVIARRTHWEAKFGHLQAVPRDGKNKLVSIDGWRPANDGHHAAAGQVREAIEGWVRNRSADGRRRRRGTAVPEDFSKRNAVARWLMIRGRTDIVAFAARGALRAVPLVYDYLFRTSRRRGARRAKHIGVDVVLSTFRATAAPWAAAKFPAHGASFAAAYAAAAAGAYGAADANVATDITASAAADAAAYASDAAAFASDTDAAHAADSAAAAAAATYSSEVVYGTAAVDAAFVVKRDRNDDLIDQPLWLNGPPDKALDYWGALKSQLLVFNEDWEVWTSWYEDRLYGRPADEWLEVRRVLIPEALWQRGPKVVNAEIKRLIAARERQRAAAAPVRDIVELKRFGATPAGTVAAEVDGPLPLLPAAGSARDHRQLLQDCRRAGDDLLTGLRNGRFNVRKDYADALEAHLKALPKRIGSGNIHTADREARFLLEMMGEDGAGLPSVFAARLRGFLQAHLGLRAYYPEVEAFYHAVQTGKLTLPFPLDAYQGVRDTTADHTPTLFAPSVGHVLAGDRISDAVDAAPTAPQYERPGETPPSPPPLKDPLGELDPTASESYRRGSMVNSLWRVFLQGDGVARSTEGWIKAADALAPNVARIIEWLSQFRG